jgi:hypothetical protein
MKTILKKLAFWQPVTSEVTFLTEAGSTTVHLTHPRWLTQQQVWDRALEETFPGYGTVGQVEQL